MFESLLWVIYEVPVLSPARSMEGCLYHVSHVSRMCSPAAFQGSCGFELQSSDTSFSIPTVVAVDQVVAGFIGSHRRSGHTDAVGKHKHGQWENILTYCSFPPASWLFLIGSEPEGRRENISLKYFFLIDSDFCSAHAAKLNKCKHRVRWQIASVKCPEEM